MKAALFISKIESSIPHLMEYLNETYLPELNRRLNGFSVELGTDEEASRELFTLVMVASGGSVRQFDETFSKCHGPFVFLSTPYDNSLACCLELKSYIESENEDGEILFGSMDKIAERLNAIYKAFEYGRKIRTMHFGVIGTTIHPPKAEFDEDSFFKTFGSKPTYISMEELVNEISKKQYVPTKATDIILSMPWDRKELENALYVYGALKRTVEKYKFDAITLKCFDLLPMRVTGCIALALLNAEGICSACEADIRSLVSMVILNTVSGNSVFMANPCQANQETNTITFAHCTLPVDMVKGFELNTHFESNLSVAVKGIFDSGSYTVFKCTEDLKRYIVKEAEFVSCPDDKLLCRTQIELKFNDIQDYFEHPINNHQLICHGKHKKAVEEFMRWNAHLKQN